MDIKEQVTAVKEYARAHYEDGKGWDYVIETMEDKDIETELGGAVEEIFAKYLPDRPPTKTAEEAIERVGELVGLWAEMDGF